ncbi:MAG: DMT family transporter [Acidimicrobiales bacterium]
MAQAMFGGLGIFHHHLPRDLVSILLLSLASAGCYGIAAVLQHREAVQHKPVPARLGLLGHLVRRPVWLAGGALDGIGYVLQFLALRHGSLALVEPLLVLSLVFALPFASRLDHRRIATSEVLSSVLIVGGLVTFLECARPALGRPSATPSQWLILSLAIAGSCSVLALAAGGGTPPRVAVLYSAGAGILFGYVAAVTERTGHLLDQGVLHVLVTWPPYALVITAVVALWLTQSAFNAGMLRLSLPTLTVGQPLVALVIGIGFFGEHIHTRGLDPLLEAIGLAVMTVGVYALTRSPSLTAPP